jgi:site-specific recombinase
MTIGLSEKALNFIIFVKNQKRSMSISSNNQIIDESLIRLFNQYAHLSTEEIQLDFIVDLVSLFRPKNAVKQERVSIEPLLNLLQENDAFRLFFKKYIKNTFTSRSFSELISDDGIIENAGFISELKKRIIEKLIPVQADENSLQYILNAVFYSSNDPIWLQKIDEQQVGFLLELIEATDLYQSAEKENLFLQEIVFSIEVLINRITGKAMEKEVKKMVPEFQSYDSPFLTLQREFSEFSDRLVKERFQPVSTSDLLYKQLGIMLNQCVSYVEQAFKNSSKYGISLKVNQSLLRIKQQLIRVQDFLPYLAIDTKEDTRKKSIRFGFKLVRLSCEKNNIKTLIGESTQSLSYEITHHTAQTGEHYITRTKSEYWNMLLSASGGGLIVGFMVIFKLYLGTIETSDFGHAFLYSMNYSLGFIIIYLLHFTLATKQPAMTASALINALENKGDNKGEYDKYQHFSVFFARVFRSQFIAFVGNVLVAFPVTLALIWFNELVTGTNMVATKWKPIMTDLSPIHSAAIFHAAIAGFFLFISGVISGYIANRDKHVNMYQRLRQHPVLKRIFGKEKTSKIASFYEKKWAGIMSNFWFGVFMGTTASIGVFFGLNLDIRHITFASGSLALGLYGNGMELPFDLLFWGVIGIGVIGLVNFLVSFTLSLTLAFRSRNISFLELRLVAWAIWLHFLDKPSHFFFPPKNDE